MTKRISLLICTLCFLMVGCGPKTVASNPPAPPLKDFTITGTWQQNFTNNEICSSTITTGCVNGFTFGYLNGTTQVPLKTDTTSVCTGSTQPESCTDTVNAQLPIGSITFYVVADYINNSGVAGTSATATTPTPTAISAAEPTNPSFTAQ